MTWLNPLRISVPGKKLSFREAVNQLLRAGLHSVETSQEARAPYNGPVFDSELLTGIDPNRMNQLADEL